MIENTFYQNLIRWGDITYMFLERPALQRQLLTIYLITLAAWYLPRIFRLQPLRFGLETSPSIDDVDGQDDMPLSRWWRYVYRLSNVSHYTYFPIFGLVIGWGAIELFKRNFWHTGILLQAQNLFWLLLGYRFVVALVNLVLEPKRANIYHNRVINPLATVLLLWMLNRILSGIVLLNDQLLFTISGNDITLGALAAAGTIVLFFLAGSSILNDLFEHVIFARIQIAQGVTNTITTISQYLLITVGSLFALNQLGINLSSLAIIGAGLSVGIGFGLQELVANFISGILLMFEQSIRPGDIIRINDTIGTVERLRIRSTTIRALDSVEMIVPNQNLLTSVVTTYTHTDTLVGLRIPVGVSYNSDPQEVRDVLLFAASRHGLVQKNPEPSVTFRGYGASSLDFMLFVLINEPLKMFRIQSDLYFIIWEEFKKRDIEIPFPQQDIHVRSGIPWEQLSVKGEAEKGEAEQYG